MRSGTFERTSILPPRCSRNVRSLTLRMTTPSMARSASVSRPECSWSLAAQVTSTTIRSGCDSVTSSAVTAPPAVPTAVVSRPTDAGSAGTSSRTVIEYDALGMAMTASSRAAGPAAAGGVLRRVRAAVQAVGLRRWSQAVVLKPVALTAAAQAASSWSPVPPLPPIPPTRTPSR